MTSRKTPRHIYRVVFHAQNRVYELYARKVSHGDLYGFIQLEELIFGETSQVLVDPQQEKLRTEFGDVKRSFVPMHAVIRIDEVEKEGVSTIHSTDGKVTQLPAPLLPPRRTE